MESQVPEASMENNYLLCSTLTSCFLAGLACRLPFQAFRVMSWMSYEITVKLSIAIQAIADAKVPKT